MNWTIFFKVLAGVVGVFDAIIFLGLLLLHLEGKARWGHYCLGFACALVLAVCAGIVFG